MLIYCRALVIILVLNLLFWLIVIIWRFCYLRKLNAVVERRRAEMRGRINDGLDNDQVSGLLSVDLARHCHTIRFESAVIVRNCSFMSLNITAALCVVSHLWRGTISELF